MPEDIIRFMPSLIPVIVIQVGLTLAALIHVLRHKTKAMTIEFGYEVDSDEVMRVLNENNFEPTNYETPTTVIEYLFLEVAK